jgi:IS5 family transposase
LSWLRRILNERLSFMRFLGLKAEDRVPYARTICLFREKLTTAMSRSIAVSASSAAYEGRRAPRRQSRLIFLRKLAVA